MKTLELYPTYKDDYEPPKMSFWEALDWLEVQGFSREKIKNVHWLPAQSSGYYLNVQLIDNKEVGVRLLEQS